MSSHKYARIVPMPVSPRKKAQLETEIRKHAFGYLAELVAPGQSALFEWHAIYRATGDYNDEGIKLYEIGVVFTVMITPVNKRPSTDDDAFDFELKG